MNIFLLDSDPYVAAKYHCDKHVVKMITESAQMLSTAHRLLDGKLSIIDIFSDQTGRYRKKKIWRLFDDQHKEDLVYKVAHPNHPSTRWTCECSANYLWHYELFVALSNEYTFRYGKVHASYQKLGAYLLDLPKNIQRSTKQTPFALAMKSNPECYDLSDPVQSYRDFYKTKKSRFKMVWTKRKIPPWF